MNMLEALGASFIMVLGVLIFVAVLFGVIYLIMEKIKNEYVSNACLAVFVFLVLWGVAFIAMLSQGV